MAMVPTAELLSSTTVSAVKTFFTQKENRASLNKTIIIMVVMMTISCYSGSNVSHMLNWFHNIYK
jgi:hypothetical protein